jgi:hypothetical protein
MAVMALAALAACSRAELSTDCPRVVVLQDLSRFVQYRDGPGRDLVDVTLEGAIVGLSPACRYDRRGVALEIRVQIEARRGPANAAGKGAFQYFAAITDPDGQILAKQIFDTDVEFRGNVTRVAIDDEIAPQIPLADRKLGAAYAVLLGFQLTEEQIGRGRRRLGR